MNLLYGTLHNICAMSDVQLFWTVFSNKAHSTNGQNNSTSVFSILFIILCIQAIWNIYKVGVKEVKNGLIYYPCKIDKDLKKYKWIRYGNNGLKGFWRAWTFGKLDTTWEEFRYRDMLKYHIPAFENAEVHQDFTSDLKKMNPIIFTPGIMGTTTLCSSICIELASYGFYVYCIEHTDKSFCYYLDTDGGYK